MWDVMRYRFLLPLSLSLPLSISLSLSLFLSVSLSLPLYHSPLPLPLCVLSLPSLSLQLRSDESVSDEGGLESCITIQPFRITTSTNNIVPTSKQKDRSKHSRGTKYKDHTSSSKNAQRFMDAARDHPNLLLDGVDGEKSHEFVISSHKPLTLLNGTHPADFFSLPHHSSPYPIPPPPLGPGSPGIIPGSPMISSPPHCSPLHLHTPQPISTLSSSSHSPHFHQAPITGPSNSFPLGLQPQPAIISSDPSSPMQVVCSAHPLMRLNGGSATFQNGTNAHFSSDSNGHIPGMVLNPSTISLQPATFLPSHSHALHPPYNTGSSAHASVRDYPQFLTGMHPSMVLGSELSSYHLPPLTRTEPPSQQYH